MMALLSAVISLSSCGKAPKEKEKNEIYAVSARVFTPLKCDPAKGIIPEMEESMKNELPPAKEGNGDKYTATFRFIALIDKPGKLLGTQPSDEEISKFLEENKSTVIADCDYKTSVRVGGTSYADYPYYVSELEDFKPVRRGVGAHMTINLENGEDGLTANTTASILWPYVFIINSSMLANPVYGKERFFLQHYDSMKSRAHLSGSTKADPGKTYAVCRYHSSYISKVNDYEFFDRPDYFFIVLMTLNKD